MNPNSNRLYAETPPVKLFFTAAIPGVISMFAMSIYNIIEGFFVGGDLCAGGHPRLRYAPQDAKNACAAHK